MEFLKRHILLVGFLLPFITSCSDKFKPVISAPGTPLREEKLGQSFLDGAFILENGAAQSLSALNDKPVLIFFVGEFCGACRQEAEHLKEMIRSKGLPTQIHLVSVMLEVDPGTVTDWLTGITPQSDHWTLGSDPQLSLYFQYFRKLVTPSVIFFDPQTQILKRWQTVVPLQQLEQETAPWY